MSYRSKKDEDLNYYKLLAKQSKGNDSSKINTDFVLFLSLVKDLLIFLIMLIPNILGFLFSLLFAKKESAKRYIEKIIYEPFELVRKVLEWFFEAKYTAYLIILLMFIYVIEVLFLVPVLETFMSHQLHLLEGNWWSIFTSIFLHGDLVHLLSNCLALLIFGRIVEAQVGHKVLYLFVASGVIANIVSNFISYSQGEIYYSLGASGGIAGLIMFAILFNPFAFTSILIIPLPIFVVGWFLIFLDLIGLTAPSQTNHLAHLGGYGALIVLFFFLEFKHRKKIIAGLTLNILLLIAFFIFLQMYGINITELLLF